MPQVSERPDRSSAPPNSQAPRRRRWRRAYSRRAPGAGSAWRIHLPATGSSAQGPPARPRRCPGRRTAAAARRAPRGSRGGSARRARARPPGSPGSTVPWPGPTPACRRSVRTAGEPVADPEPPIRPQAPRTCRSGPPVDGRRREAPTRSPVDRIERPQVVEERACPAWPAEDHQPEAGHPGGGVPEPARGSVAGRVEPLPRVGRQVQAPQVAVGAVAIASAEQPGRRAIGIHRQRVVLARAGGPGLATAGPRERLRPDRGRGSRPATATASSPTTLGRAEPPEGRATARATGAATGRPGDGEQDEREAGGRGGGCISDISSTVACTQADDGRMTGCVADLERGAPAAASVRPSETDRPGSARGRMHMSLWKEYKEFLTKSNALALAVGIIIGVALGAVVTSLVNDIIMPVVGYRARRRRLLAVQDRPGGSGRRPGGGPGGRHPVGRLRQRGHRRSWSSRSWPSP